MAVGFRVWDDLPSMGSTSVVVRERLEAALSSLGVNRAELARRLDCSKPTISNILDGETRLTFDWVDRICEAIGIEPDEVISEAVVNLPTPQLKALVADLAGRGLRREVSSTLGDIENALLSIQPSFHAMIEAAKADAGIILWKRNERVYPVFHTMSSHEARGLARQYERKGRLPEGWQVDEKQVSGFSLVAGFDQPVRDVWRGRWKYVSLALGGNLARLGVNSSPSGD